MKKVLLVEDDVVLHDLYKEALTPHDITVTAVTTGKECIASALTNAPDLVMLDIMLPGGMNGFDVARELRQNPKTSATPILILTNLDSEKASADAVKAEYMVKTNTSMDEIVGKVKSMLNMA
ncbi:response regulator transcription factor [Candidatus Gottesmanbacteria bacterium]|nr:response regulator transcription factor [Candidatus Gottesmanbacteria bacterium]